MITQEILDSFVYETFVNGGGEWNVTDPTEFDQVLVAGPFKTKEAAEAALIEYVKVNGITFE
jgi:hypothetical protein